MTEQLALDLFPKTEKPTEPCIWLEWWNGYKFCYLRQTYRLPCPGCESAEPRHREWPCNS